MPILLFLVINILTLNPRFYKLVGTTYCLWAKQGEILANSRLIDRKNFWRIIDLSVIVETKFQPKSTNIRMV